LPQSTRQVRVERSAEFRERGEVWVKAWPNDNRRMIYQRLPGVPGSLTGAVKISRKKDKAQANKANAGGVPLALRMPNLGQIFT
jgi:hypothetical protein